MKKLIIYVDDDKAEMLTTLLGHIDFVKSVESDIKPASDVFPELNDLDRQDSGYSDDNDHNAENSMAESKNIQQLRSALAAIDNARDRNKKTP
jgi:hypothetical protein